MDRVFVYGISVKGDNFTDRVKETERLKMNFENGMNSIIISPRRMGKTSLVDRVISRVKGNPDIITVFMDIYDCKDEYDFYNVFACSIIEQTASKVDQWIENAKEFLMRITPKLSITGDPNQEFSLSLGITPSTHSPREILNLPEIIAKKRGKHIVVCIDEFQQIGEMKDTLSIQKRLRGVWQHQENCTYCLFGSKMHLMSKLFQNNKMPFYEFGEMLFLKPIPTQDWVDYIQKRFESRGKQIDNALCEKICEITQNHSSYVQQLAWNVFVETDKVANEQSLENGFLFMMEQCTSLFQDKLANLTVYQRNMLRAIASNVHDGFTSKFILDSYNLGTKSNISRLESSLIEKELIKSTPEGLFFDDPIFALWCARNLKR